MIIRPKSRLNFYRRFRFLVDGTSRHGLPRPQGTLLDGNRDEQPGGDFIHILRGYRIKPALRVLARGFVPLPWMTDARWFLDEPATFVVIETRVGAAYPFGVTEWNCVNSFGALEAWYEVGPYTVLIWDHDLRSQLDK